MDPVSAIELGVVAFEVLECAGKILNFLLKISTKFQYANIKVQLLIGFLSSLRISINEIAKVADGLAGRRGYEDVMEGLRTTLDCTKNRRVSSRLQAGRPAIRLVRYEKQNREAHGCT